MPRTADPDVLELELLRHELEFDLARLEELSTSIAGRVFATPLDTPATRQAVTRTAQALAAMQAARGLLEAARFELEGSTC